MARGDLVIPTSERDDTQDNFKESVNGFGLVIEGPTEVKVDEFYLWPENVAVWNLWVEIQTQWHVSDGQRTGLKYESVMICLNLCRSVAKRNRPEVFKLLQAMECSALNEWYQHK